MLILLDECERRLFAILATQNSEFIALFALPHLSHSTHKTKLIPNVLAFRALIRASNECIAEDIR